MHVAYALTRRVPKAETECDKALLAAYSLYTCLGRVCDYREALLSASVEALAELRHKVQELETHLESKQVEMELEPFPLAFGQTSLL